MKRIQIFTIIICLGIPSLGQSIEDLSFGTDSTFEVLTWNIEWFPKNAGVTIEYVSQIIEALDVDLLAIQEVDNIKSFNQLMDSLKFYTGYLESGWFAGLAYIYKPNVIQVNDIYEIYTTSPFWSPFPRSPMVMDLNFKNERIFVINNHLKCCGDGILDTGNKKDEETRRLQANTLLKEYIDLNLPNENVIIVGDLNDQLSDVPQNNVFQPFFDDSENYLFTDYEIAMGDTADWSYPTWPSHLDHILISNELFDDFKKDNSVISTIKVDEYLRGGWRNYEEDISDHRPVALKLELNSPLSSTTLNSSSIHFYVYPNPIRTKTTLTVNEQDRAVAIEITNLHGQMVFSKNIPAGETSVIWDAHKFPDGFYFAKLKSNSTVLDTLKLMLAK